MEPSLKVVALSFVVLLSPLARPIFGTICVLWIISDFIYIDYKSLETLCFSEQFQAYHVKMCEDVGTKLCSYESLVDFNVFHYHEDNKG